MIVYGDHKRIESAGYVRGSACKAAGHIADMPSGIERHAALVGLFIKISELVQGLADAEFEANGMDRNSRQRIAGANLLVGLARDVGRSWAAGFAIDGPVRADVPRMLAELDCDGEILIDTAEGYAHYALYPESYFVAARQSGLDANTCVIGIRSIGLGLAAMVAAAIGAPEPVSVRPTGHPFRRRLAADPELIGSWMTKPSARFAIVDEGPGLSGSSFHAVVAWLQRLGIDAGRIHLFPSHSAGPGPEASTNSREAWTVCQKHSVDFERTFPAGSAVPTLRDWVARTIGSTAVNLTEISGGEWRRFRDRTEEHWPPVHRGFERRKFLASAGREKWSVKFVGLGEIGMHKAETARRLNDAGFGPDIAGLCHGFLVERWIDGTTLERARHSKEKMVAHLARYLSWRAANLPASEPGASLEALADMAVQNTSEALGESRAAELRNWFSKQAPPKTMQRVEIDGRLHPWEFILSRGGTLIKTDALDHCRSHDLVGCQDIAWDIAGARVEYSLADAATAALCKAVEATTSRPVDANLVHYYEPCYLAFQLGLWSMAERSGDDREQIRLAAAARRYAAALLRFLENQGELRPFDQDQSSRRSISASFSRMAATSSR
ncbi:MULTISPECIES: hypothetical protein [unclassified Mesorhizobium]|uniref:hypothetical protein n=1 Tax=unclassified Mesorhizobium TaxID=325217 RepID=UPI003338891E